MGAPSADGTRAIDVLLLGNCLDQGTDVKTGTSFAELTIAAVRQSHPGVEIRFVRELLPHLTLLDRSVDHALRRAFDVVIIGAMTYNVQSAQRINRLWALDPRLAQGVVSAMRAMRRSAGKATAGRSVIEDTRWTEPLRVKVPRMSIAEYEQVFDTQVARLRAARVEVVLRGNDSAHDRIVGVSDQGVDEVLTRVASRHEAFSFFPAETLTGHPLDVTRVKTTRDGEVNHSLDERGHRLVARSMEVAVGAAVDRVLAARAAGRPGVIARVDQTPEGITRL